MAQFHLREAVYYRTLSEVVGVCAELRSTRPGGDGEVLDVLVLHLTDEATARFSITEATPLLQRLRDGGRL